MLIIPEIETVVILPPRTGSGSLYRAVLKEFPNAFMPYRHMEADGVPFGYDRYRRLGVLRRPLLRMWSLYKYLKTFGDDHQAHGHFENYYRSRKDSVAGLTFEQWLVRNTLPFSVHVDDLGKVRPLFMQKHMMPENRKSQHYYLRPDLGVEIVPYCPQASFIGALLGIEVPKTNNVTGGSGPDPLSVEAREFLLHFHRWDSQECDRLRVPFA